jgi:hypothetical protein
VAHSDLHDRLTESYSLGLDDQIDELLDLIEEAGSGEDFLQRDRRPRGHCRADRPCATLAASVATMPRPRSHRASAGTGTLRRAKSSITIEPA